MPGFQAINAARPPADAPGVEESDSDVPTRRRRPAPRRASPTADASPRRPRLGIQARSPTPDDPADIPELATRDWNLIKIVDKEIRYALAKDPKLGVFYYKAQWEPTVLDVSFVRLVDGVQSVRYRGAYWRVSTLGDPAMNDGTGVLEAEVSWEDTWHPLWEFTSALESITAWEMANDPDKNSLEKRHHWWRFLPTLRGHRDPQTEFDPGMYREIDGDEIIPETDCDYTFALMERLIDELASGDKGPVPHATIIDLLNNPLRQRFIFKQSFVESGKTYRLHREDLVRAAMVCIVGHAREDHCNVCVLYPQEVPFSDCLVFGTAFDG